MVWSHYIRKKTNYQISNSFNYNLKCVTLTPLYCPGWRWHVSCLSVDLVFMMNFVIMITADITLPVAKLLWTEVFNKSSNNSGLQSMYFLSSKKRIYYIWNTHGVSWYTWCGFCKPVFSKEYAHIQVDSMNTAYPLLYWLTVLTHRGILFSSCKKMNLPI